MKLNKVKEITVISVFSSLILLLAFIPGLGFIPVGPTRATIIHVPVIVASILFGKKIGGILGFVFGLTSLINNTINPTITSFVFSPFYSGGNLFSLVICFVPRIMLGIVPRFLFDFFNKKFRSLNINLFVTGFFSSLVNTVLVMNFIFIFFNEEYSVANGNPSSLYMIILGVILINGTLEAFLAAFINLFSTKVLLRLR